jgi:uncharacterized iron-regulated protein
VRLLPLLLAATLLTVGVAACAGTRHTVTYPAIDVDAPDVRDPSGRATLRAEAIAARLRAARCVYVAEQHADPAYHAVQRAVLERLSGSGAEVVIAVEWLPPSAEPALDSWLAGRDPVATLMTALDWPRRWGHEFAAYAPIFRWARERGVPIAPVNAERDLARAVARAPLAEVPPETRAQLPPLDTGNPPHRAFFDAMMRAAMAGHGGAPLADTVLDRYYLAQLVWDETMSRRVAELLTDPAHPGRVVVVFAGVGHILHGLGVPQRVNALTGLPFTIVLPVPAAELAERETVASDAPYPIRDADLLWVVP